ncbi:MAG: hypothetical protein ACP5DZ_06370 [Bacteroidales bacterium]
MGRDFHDGFADILSSNLILEYAFDAPITTSPLPAGTKKLAHLS